MSVGPRTTVLTNPPFLGVLLIGHGSRATCVLKRRRSNVAEGCRVIGLHRRIVGHTVHNGTEGHLTVGYV